MIDDEEFLQAIRDVDSPVAGTSEIADAVGMQRKGASQRLTQLAERGEVETRLVGSVRIWWLPDRD